MLSREEYKNFIRDISSEMSKEFSVVDFSDKWIKLSYLDEHLKKYVEKPKIKVEERRIKVGDIYLDKNGNPVKVRRTITEITFNGKQGLTRVEGENNIAYDGEGKQTTITHSYCNLDLSKRYELKEIKE